MLPNIQETTLQFGTEIDAVARNLNGLASGFAPIEPPKRKELYCVLRSIFEGSSMPRKKLPFPGDFKV